MITSDRATKDFSGRRYAQAAAISARAAMARAHEAKRCLARPELAFMAAMFPPRIAREVKSARYYWRSYLHWRRIYRADESNDVETFNRLLNISPTKATK